MVLPSLTRRRGSGPWKDCMWGGELPSAHGLPLRSQLPPTAHPTAPTGQAPAHSTSTHGVQVGVGLPAVVPP